MNLTVEVINFEEEANFFIVSLPGKLMHGFDKLGQGYGPASILVKYTKCPFHKKFLKYVTEIHKGLKSLKYVTQMHKYTNI